jgi:hypothetical protein
MPFPKHDAFDELFREAFEGRAPDASGTWFVEKDEAIFNSIRNLTAPQASLRVTGQLASIGAHVRHLNYYLWLFNEHVRNTAPASADWEASWAVQEFTDESWADMQKELAEEYAFTRNTLASVTEFPESSYVTPTLANIAHAAYHLGAIRALLPIVLASS